MVPDPSKSSYGLEPNIAAGLASLFGLIGGIVILLGKPPQPWVRFIAMQAIVLWAVWFVLSIAISILATMLWMIPAVGGTAFSLILIVRMLVGLALFVAWLIATIRAFQGTAWRIPIIGDLADRWVGSVPA